eukprot:CAMPEP_0180346662 /NCGR_PEP_ID=MMETSP0989-20121125/3995_1 /TAXON_ID=697907 /ORGANISM="non described non described, Strain CCMP2293" /LENGTH=104 /DNA_ID=CAMNT_0022335813 /DNA_START=41 /DNA_END=355 /DNA_ORIENTATION=+
MSEAPLYAPPHSTPLPEIQRAGARRCGANLARVGAEFARARIQPPPRGSCRRATSALGAAMNSSPRGPPATPMNTKSARFPPPFRTSGSLHPRQPCAEFIAQGR